MSGSREASSEKLGGEGEERERELCSFFGGEDREATDLGVLGVFEALGKRALSLSLSLSLSPPPAPSKKK